MKRNEIIEDKNYLGHDQGKPKITISTLSNLSPILLEKMATDFSDSFFETPNIFRGTHGTDKELYYVDPKQYMRLSQNTTNEYTWLVSTLSSWKKFPKRSRSLVCSTNIDRTYNYGNLTCVVIPRNGAKFGVSSQRDFWFSFPKVADLGISSMNEFNKCIGNILRYFKVYKFDSYNQFIEAIKIADSRMLTMTNGQLSFLAKNGDKLKRDKDDYRYTLSIVNPLIKYYLELRTTYPDALFSQSINILLDPIENNFLIEPTKNITSGYYGDNEIWTDSDCYLIPESNYNYVRNEVLRFMK